MDTNSAQDTTQISLPDQPPPCKTCKNLSLLSQSEVEGAQWTPLCCSQLEKAQGGFPLFRAPSSSAGPRPADLFLDPPAVPPPPDR